MQRRETIKTCNTRGKKTQKKVRVHRQYRPEKPKLSNATSHLVTGVAFSQAKYSGAGLAREGTILSHATKDAFEEQAAATIMTTTMKEERDKTIRSFLSIARFGETGIIERN